MSKNRTYKNTSSTQLTKEQKTRRTVKRMWYVFTFFLSAIFILIILIYNGVIGFMPPISELKNPRDRYASVIYTADGKEMGRFFKNTGNRVYADFSEISQYVVDGLIATEDERFLEHSGIDIRALGRVLVKTILSGDKTAGGGSTITQQLAKQLYSPESATLASRALKKPVEWMIAIKLEREYSKEEILKMYLNQFDFLYNAVGIKSAAHVYFDKDPRDLTLEEAATLVGMCKNPSYYNPRRHPERTRDRRNTVLEMMYKTGKINREDYEIAAAKPIELKYNVVDHKQGIAPYFREELRRILLAKKPNKKDYPRWDMQKFHDDSLQWLTNPLYGWVEKNPKPDGSKWDIYNDGLKIYTTIDSRMQKYAEQAVHEHLSSMQRLFFAERRGSATAPYIGLNMKEREDHINLAWKNSERYLRAKEEGRTPEEINKIFNTKYDMQLFTYRGEVDTVMTPRDSIIYTKHYLRAGFMAMDPRNGYVKAYVGGPNFKFFQYDMVSTGRRQIGSTVKPYLYCLAMESGMSPCTRMLCTQPVLRDGKGEIWIPKGAGTGGMVDLKWALTNSNNWISAKLIDELKPKKLIKFMHTLGISSQLPNVYSLSLGSCEISLREQVTAYSAFANTGMKVDPMYVTSISDGNGNVIATFTPKINEVISRLGYYKILTMLQSVVDNGTGRGLRGQFGLKMDIGGKTGTTNDNSDAWFIGFTPSLVAGTWVGGDERSIHFINGGTGQGAVAALPVFGKFLKKVYADKSLNYDPNEKFFFPKDIEICADSDYHPSSSDSYGSYGGGKKGKGAAKKSSKGASIKGAFD